MARVKQWFSYLHKAYSQEADELFAVIRPLKDSASIAQAIAGLRVHKICFFCHIAL